MPEIEWSTPEIEWSTWEIEGDHANLFNAEGKRVDVIYLDGLIEYFLDKAEGYTQKTQ